jgi:hypothetical protein
MHNQDRGYWDKDRLSSVFEKVAALQVDDTISDIREDAWNGRGPGEYQLTPVTYINVQSDGQILPMLFVNGKYAGYLHGGSDVTASTFAQMVNKAACPFTLTLHGHYGNTAFYIDRIELSRA